MSRHLIAVLFCSALIATPLSALAAQEQVPYLLTVASKGDVVTVKSLLNSGVNPNTRDADGITALMYATRKDKADVVKALLEKGADATLRNARNSRPKISANTTGMTTDRRCDAAWRFSYWPPHSMNTPGGSFTFSSTAARASPT